MAYLLAAVKPESTFSHLINQNYTEQLSRSMLPLAA
jgi:hypothetical protein